MTFSRRHFHSTDDLGKVKHTQKLLKLINLDSHARSRNVLPTDYTLSFIRPASSFPRKDSL